MSKITVAILNWNGTEFLSKFLPSVVNNSTLTDYSVEIVVIDNGSTDSSITFLHQNFPSVKIIPLDQNYGFTGGYNRGIAQITSEYTVLLNSDVETPENWLLPLVKLMDSDPKIGACMPKVLSYQQKQQFEYAGGCGGWIDKLGYPFCRGRILTTIENDVGQYDNQQSVFWATGACCLVRTEIYKTLGGLDEQFYLHMEEIDLCWRMQLSGYKIVVEPKSKVFHLGGGTLPKTNPRKLYYNYRNTLYMLYKNLDKSSRYLILLRIFLDWIAASVYLITGEFRNLFAVLQAHRDFCKNYKKLKKSNAQKRLIDLDGVRNKLILYDYKIGRKKYYSQLK